jgi:hypothetical protein
MPNTNKKIPSVSLNKYDICNNTKHPIPSQEINPSSKNIPQTRCAISLINRPQPFCCRDFSATLFLPQFFCLTFSAVIFLPHFFCCDFSVTLFLPQFFCSDFSVALFLPNFSCHIFPPHFSCRTFSVALFLPLFFCCNFSLLIIPAQIHFHKIDIQ